MKTGIKAELIAARAVIADPAHWTRGVMARDSRGLSVLPNEPEAFCFCMLGALRKVVGKFNPSGEHKSFLRDAIQAYTCKSMPIGDFNDDDTHGHDDVLQVFNMAIEKAPE